MQPLSRRLQTRRGSVVLTAILLGLPCRPLPAADPYDTTLERRVAALEREMSTLAEDAKGKNPLTYEGPAFLRAAGRQVQQLTLQGDLRFRYQYDNDELQAPSKPPPAPSSRAAKATACA